MVDVGAHFGGSLAPFLRADWRVLAFEPDRRNRDALAAAFGDIPSLTIDRRAVSERSESGVVLFRSSLSTGISGLSKFHDSHEPADRVDTVSLTQAMAEHGLTRVDFLKVDTEGHDLFVLRGIDWELSAPTTIMCEFEDLKTRPLGYDYDTLASYLTDRGYHVIVSEWYPVEAYGQRHAWRSFGRYPKALSHAAAWGNLLATRDLDLLASLERQLSDMADAMATVGRTPGR
jgi:FkbM family methyltransferase